MERTSLKERVALALADVEGWLYLDEAWALHEAARTATNPSLPATVIEIGSWKGRSTIALALGVRSRGAGTVFAIDPHTRDGTATGHLGTANEFHRNIDTAGVDSLVRLIMATSHEARPQFAAESIDMLFIDGSHKYEDVKADITDWQTALKDEAVIAFNDPSWPGVYRALRQLVLRPRTAYRRPVLVQNTLFFQFRRSEPWRLKDAIALLRLRAVLGVRYQVARFRPLMPNWLVRAGHTLSARMVGRNLDAN
jgi:predicted O-methyltransferase YrrM